MVFPFCLIFFCHSLPTIFCVSTIWFVCLISCPCIGQNQKKAVIEDAEYKLYYFSNLGVEKSFGIFDSVWFFSTRQPSPKSLYADTNCVCC
jgi:hypothetical protein